jgi:hypothetical protein
LTVFVDYDKITFVLTINNEGESTWKKWTFTKRL